MSEWIKSIMEIGKVFICLNFTENLENEWEIVLCPKTKKIKNMIKNYKFFKRNFISIIGILRNP